MKRELLDNGNIWQKSDGRWIGMVRYKDEYGVTQRKSFSSKKRKTLQAKMTEYVANFQEQVANSDESRKPLKESMKNWLRVYKFPEVERTTYDRYECTAEHQIYPYIGNKPVGDVTLADIKKLLTKHMNADYAFTTSKKAYSILKMFFKQLYQEGAIPSNPMAMIDMTKKDNYLAAQKKESKPQCDIIFCKTRSILPADRCFIQIVNQNRKNLFLISVLSVFTDSAYDSSGFQICCLRAVAGGNVWLFISDMRYCEIIAVILIALIVRWFLNQSACGRMRFRDSLCRSRKPVFDILAYRPPNRPRAFKPHPCADDFSLNPLISKNS